MRKDEDSGMIPLHHACAKIMIPRWLLPAVHAAAPYHWKPEDLPTKILLCFQEYQILIIEMLLQAAPESSMVTDNQGRTAPQLLKPVASLMDETGMLLFHRQAARSKGLTTNL
jgi:hypothetical protein